MELGKMGITLFILILCIIPFVLMAVRKKNEEGGLLARMTAFAAENNYKIIQYESCGKIAMGLDSTNNILFFAQTIDKEESFREVSLAEIEACKLDITHKTNKSKEKVVDKIQMVFVAKEGKANFVIELYNSSRDMTLIGELQLAEKWCGIVNNKL